VLVLLAAGLTVRSGDAQVRTFAFRSRQALETPNGAAFCDNYISTTKYSVLSFLPFCLLEQFKAGEIASFSHD
jgi:hypothetical protein